MSEQLTKVIVNLTEQSMAALDDAARIEGDTRTETINRAIQLYCLMVFARRTGSRVWVGYRRWRAGELTWE
ncbi:MAG TPA: hypothetical protein VFY84_12705 [Jiangellales bacterium]|nr:hypothetical protein [Jiangellales bacterium]